MIYRDLNEKNENKTFFFALWMKKKYKWRILDET